MKQKLLFLAIIIFISVCTNICIDAQIINRRFSNIKAKEIQQESDSLFNLGMQLYNNSLFEKAIPYFLKSDSLEKEIVNPMDYYVDYGKMWAASCYYKSGQEDFASILYDDYKLEPINKFLTIKSDSILIIANRLEEGDNLEEAIAKYAEASEIECLMLGEDSYWYANTLIHCAALCKAIGKDEQAISFYLKYVNSAKKGKKIEEGYPQITLEIAAYYASMGDSASSIIYCNETLRALESLKESEELCLSITEKIAYIYTVIGEAETACDICKKVLPFYRKKKGDNSFYEGYVNTLLILSSYSHDISNKISYDEELKECTFDKDVEICCQALIRLAYSYNDAGQFRKAMECAKESVEILEKLPECELNLFYNALSILATCYSLNGYDKDALRIGKKIYELLDRDEYRSSSQFAMTTYQLSNYYSHLGFYKEQEKYLLETIYNSRKDSTGFCLPILAEALSSLADLYVDIDLKKALRYQIESSEISSKVFGEKSYLANLSLYKFGICLNEISLKEKDIEIGKEAADCIFGAISNVSSILGEKDIRYAQMKWIITDLMVAANRYDDAIKNEEEISKIFLSSLGKDHIYYLRSQEKLAKLFFTNSNEAQMVECINHCYEGYNKYVALNLPILTSKERAKLIYNIIPFCDYILPAIVYYRNTSELNSLLYDTQLLRKGLLLDADKESAYIIRETKDTALIYKHNELMRDLALLYKIRQIPIDERTINEDSLRTEIEAREDNLLRGSVHYKESIQRKNSKWGDIQAAIKEDELAIEFVSFFDTCKVGKEHYIALAFNNVSPNPELIHLFVNDTIQNLTPEKAYQLIWNPILERFKGAKTIYFSPTGILNNIAIEYMFGNTEGIHAYRLSSTRELLNKKHSKPLQNAVLYGGLSYDAELYEEHKFDITSSQSLSIMYRGLVDTLMSRGSFDPLPNTLVEIKNIEKMLTSKNISTILFTDVYGTEDSFKNLSGKDFSILHLATHGMYVSSTEALSRKKERGYRFILLDDEENYEDTSLSRSFLAMSGGNMLPCHIYIPDMMEDGILTALEISNLDFCGLDLVVLSACQTALGDVNKEGVYGLQRAFKKAGANTILMSLDKVDDEATRILMVEFYKNLMAGKSKHQSLKDAQKYLRNVENGKYDDPKYWASFIMLDGLN